MRQKVHNRKNKNHKNRLPMVRVNSDPEHFLNCWPIATLNNELYHCSRVKKDKNLLILNFLMLL